MDYCANTTLKAMHGLLYKHNFIKKRKRPLLLRLLTTNYSYSIKRVVVTVVVVVTPPQGRGGKGGGLEGVCVCVWGGGGVWLSTWQELRESDDAALCTQRLTAHAACLTKRPNGSVKQQD